MAENFKIRFMEFLNAAYPLLGIDTFEEARALGDIRDVVKDGKVKRSYYEWDESNQLMSYKLQGKGEVELVQGCKEPMAAIGKVVAEKKSAVLVMKDIHPHLDKSPLWRTIRNQVGLIKEHGICVVFLCARLKIPPELSKDVQILDYAMPSREALEKQFTTYMETNLPEGAGNGVVNGFVSSVAEAAMGMTQAEADNAFALATINSARLHNRAVVLDQGFVKSIFEVKIANLKNTALEYMPTHAGFESVGGLEGVKAWAGRRREGFNERARELHLPYPKGVLLAGIKGCIAGDTPMDVWRQRHYQPMTLREFYKRSQKQNGYRLSALRRRDADATGDDAIMLHDVVTVIPKGEREVVKIMFEFGKFLECTPDHLIAIKPADYWKPAQSLVQGDEVISFSRLKGRPILSHKTERVTAVLRENRVTDVYDIEMAEPYHNFVADGIVVHNCGKTTTAMAIAHQFQFPLFKFDVTKLYAGKVGESEALTRDVIRLMESLGRCCVLVDEMEKFFSTEATSGGGDSGVSSRLFGTLVSWMSLKTCPVFMIGTLNNFDRLPPELTRKGRFDEVFFVDLPTEVERVAIFNALIKHKFKAQIFENCLVPELIEKTRDFSGAELEAVIEEALYGLLENPQAKGEDLLMYAADSIKPQAQLEPELVTRLRNKAAGFKQASLVEEVKPVALLSRGKRKLSLN